MTTPNNNTQQHRKTSRIIVLYVSLLLISYLGTCQQVSGIREDEGGEGSRGFMKRRLVGKTIKESSIKLQQELNDYPQLWSEILDHPINQHEALIPSSGEPTNDNDDSPSSDTDSSDDDDDWGSTWASSDASHTTKSKSNKASSTNWSGASSWSSSGKSASNGGKADKNDKPKEGGSKGGKSTTQSKPSSSTSGVSKSEDVWGDDGWWGGSIWPTTTPAEHIAPTNSPSNKPKPAGEPTGEPKTSKPISQQPTTRPIDYIIPPPTASPTIIIETYTPSVGPSITSSDEPSYIPTTSTKPTPQYFPSSSPTVSNKPTISATSGPSELPTNMPSIGPSEMIESDDSPTYAPSDRPISEEPTGVPTVSPR